MDKDLELQSIRELSTEELKCIVGGGQLECGGPDWTPGG